MAKFLQDAAMTRKRARTTTEDDNDDDLHESIASRDHKSIKRNSTVSVTTSGRKSKKIEPEPSAIIYVGHIPHGFYEKEMRSFFKQFGKVVKLKLFRSSKSERSKGYAFLQFETHDIAKTVSETMDGYFIHERQLVSNVVPISKCHDGMFKRPKKSVLNPRSTTDSTADNSEADKDVDNSGVSQQKLDTLMKKQKQKQQKLHDLGIDYDIFLTMS